MPQTEGTRARKTLEKLRAQVAVDDRASWAGPMPTLSAADDERLEKALDAALEKYRPRGLGRTQKASGGSVNSESSRRSAAPLRRIGNRRCSSTNLLHLLKRRNQRILAIAGAFASLMLVSGVALAAGGAMGAIFGGGDQGTQGASVAGSAQPGGQEVTQVGITVRVTGFIADDTRTVIGLIVEGRDDLGAAAFPRAQARLVDQKGRIYAESGGKADQENPRLSTHYFPPLDTGTTSVTLEINGLSFAQWDQGRASQDQTPIDAQWRLTIALTNRPATSQLVATDAEPRGLGAGSVVIDQIRQAPSGTVISGHISGFSMDELAELGLTGSLLGNGGSKVDFEALRMGYGEGRQLFEMRFPRVSGQVTLAISGLVPPHPHDASIGATLRDKLGDNPTGEWRITLP